MPETPLYTHSPRPDVDTGEQWGRGASTFSSIIENLTSPVATDLITHGFALHAPSASKPVLDNGCGTGVVTEAIKKASPLTPVVATDISSGMLEQLAQKKLPGVTVQVADSLDLRAAVFEDGHFSHAFSTFCLQFTPDPNKGLSEMARVVQPGGLVGVVNWGKLGMFTVLEEAMRLQQPDFEIDERLWRSVWKTKEDVEEGMDMAGLEVVVSEVGCAPWEWFTKDVFGFYLFEGGNPFVEEAKKKFRGDLGRAREDVERWVERGEERPPCETFVTIGRKTE